VLCCEYLAAIFESGVVAISLFFASLTEIWLAKSRWLQPPCADSKKAKARWVVSGISGSDGVGVGQSGRGSGWECRAGEDAEGSGSFEPVPFVIEVGIDPNGPGDRIEVRGRRIVDGFEEAFEDASDMTSARLKEAGCVCVAVDGGTVREVVIFGDFLGAAPADELAFDGVAVGMGANGTAARVPGEVGDVGRFGGRDQGEGSRWVAGRVLGGGFAFVGGFDFDCGLTFDCEFDFGGEAGMWLVGCGGCRGRGAAGSEFGLARGT